MSSIIKVNTYQDANGNALFSSDGSGNVTLSSNDMKATPAFHAFKNSNSNLTSGATSKVSIDTEVFDSDGKYDAGNYRFTPTVAGKYFVYGKCISDPSNYENERSSNLYIYKNGSTVPQSHANAMTGGNSSADGATATTYNVNAIVDMNGSSDYVELYFRHNTWSDSGAQAGNKQFGAYRILT